MAQLSAAEIRHYESEGWVIPRYRLPEPRVAAMRAALHRLLRENPGVRPEKLVSAHIEGDNGEGVRGSASFLGLALDRDLVDLVSLGDRRRRDPLGLSRLLQAGGRGLPLNQRLADDTFDEAAAVDLELEPGQMSLHDVYMIHGAAANRSTRRRTGVALRYMPATSVFERDLRPADGKTGVAVDFARRPLWLVKGIDRSGRNDLDVGHRRAAPPP